MIQWRVVVTGLAYEPHLSMAEIQQLSYAVAIAATPAINVTVHFVSRHLQLAGAAAPVPCVVGFRLWYFKC